MRRMIDGLVRWLAPVAAGVLLAACAETAFIAQTAKQIGKPRPEAQATTAYKVGQPYQVDGVWYYPAENYDYDETGVASWYGADFHGKLTANGEIYDMNALTAAHTTLPLPCFVRVINLDNGRSLVLRINDRGPFVRGRVIDVSRRGAQLLGFEQAGTARVRVQILADESRAIALRLKGDTRGFAGHPQDPRGAAQSAVSVQRLPKPTVSSETLPPPPGAKVASVDPVFAPRDLGAKPGTTGSRPPNRTSAYDDPVSGVVSQGNARSTQLFIQAGAFSQHENAQRVRRALSHVGPVKVSRNAVNGKGIYRVRVGPMTSVEDADRVLASVVQAGYPGATIVVD